MLRQVRSPSAILHAFLFRLNGLRLAHRRQQDVQQPHPGGKVEQVDQVAGTGLGSRLPAAHDAGVDLQASGQPPLGQLCGFDKRLQPRREVLGELLTLHMVTGVELEQLVGQVCEAVADVLDEFANVEVGYWSTTLSWPLCASYFGRSESGVIVVCNCRS